VLTVLTLSDMLSAMLPMVSPLASRRKTWNSRSESCSCGSLSGLPPRLSASSSATGAVM